MEMQISCQKNVQRLLITYRWSFLEEPLWLHEHDVAMNVYNTFLEYTPCRAEGDRVEGSTAQLAHHVAWIAAVVICLTE